MLPLQWNTGRLDLIWTSYMEGMWGRYNLYNPRWSSIILVVQRKPGLQNIQMISYEVWFALGFYFSLMKLYANDTSWDITTEQLVNWSTNMSIQNQLSLTISVMGLTKESCLALRGEPLDSPCSVISLTKSTSRQYNVYFMICSSDLGGILEKLSYCPHIHDYLFEDGCFGVDNSTQQIFYLRFWGWGPLG